MATPFYNDYERLGEAHEGSFATVYKVRHLKYGYVRALKVLKDSISSESDKKFETFIKECEMLLKVGNGCHPNIVRIFQPRLINNQATVEMDFINGLDLEEYLSRTKFMPIDEVYKFIRQIGDALAYCHRDVYLDQLDWDKYDLECDPNDGSQPLIDEATRSKLIKDYRIIHNDLHSRNVMRRHRDGNFFLLDFGLAIQNGIAVKSSSLRKGAPEYRSPEKCNGADVERPENDIYSFGVLLYEVLTGLPPFPLDKAEYASHPEKAISRVEDRHLTEEPAPIEPKRKAAFEAAHPGETWQRDYPEWLEQMVMKCLAKKPEDRYADAKELIEDFDCHLAEDSSVHSLLQREDGLLQPQNVSKPDNSTNAERDCRDHVTIHDASDSDQQSKQTKPRGTQSRNETFSKLAKYVIMALVALFVIVYLISRWIGLPAPVRQLQKDMVLVENESGSYFMGTTIEEDSLAYENEATKRVDVHDFYICKYEVTQELWEAIMGNNPSHHVGKSLPVDGVSYNDCQEFIRRLNKMTGENYRLPDEGEWEFAARGGKFSHRYLFAGSNNLDDVAWYDKNSSDSGIKADTCVTHLVGEKAPNELGLYDMTGNVMEWTSSEHEKNDLDESLKNVPRDSTLKVRHTLRGGSCYSELRASRVTYRKKYGTQGYASQFIGFRLVKSK